MSFDDIPVCPPGTQTDLDRLIQALRSPLPNGFEWDFRSFDTCACGLAERMGLSINAIIDALPPGTRLPNAANHPFRMREKDGFVPLYGVLARDVTPAMVADVLERLAQPSASPMAMPLIANRASTTVIADGVEIDLTAGGRH